MSEPRRSRILIAARDVFLRYGFKRASMNDIAEAVGISRPALYLLFKNKEEIFVGVLTQWVDETIAAIRTEIATLATPRQKIERAFEIWTVRPFEITMTSREAKELIECGFDFAQPSLRDGYRTFEATIEPVVAALIERRPATATLSPGGVAHVIASAVHGFKETATTPGELRTLIRDLLLLSFGTEFAPVARAASPARRARAR